MNDPEAGLMHVSNIFEARQDEGKLFLASGADDEKNFKFVAALQKAGLGDGIDTYSVNLTLLNAGASETIICTPVLAGASGQMELAPLTLQTDGYGNAYANWTVESDLDLKEIRVSFARTETGFA